MVRLGSLALLVLIQWLSENRRKVKGSLRDAKWSGIHTHPHPPPTLTRISEPARLVIRRLMIVWNDWKK